MNTGITGGWGGCTTEQRESKVGDLNKQARKPNRNLGQIVVQSYKIHKRRFYFKAHFKYIHSRFIFPRQ